MREEEIKVKGKEAIRKGMQRKERGKEEAIG